MTLASTCAISTGMASAMTQINVRVTPELYDRLTLTQANTGKSQSEIVRVLLEKHLDTKPRGAKGAA